MFKKSLSVLLAVILVMSVFAALPVTSSAQSTDIVEVGANLDVAETGNPYPQYNYYNSASDYQIACTWYAWEQAYNNLGVSIPDNWGHAGSWYGNARNKGASPKAGSIACWSYDNSPYYGHVAYVTGVNSDGSFNIVEGGSNWPQADAHGICSRTVRQGQYWPDLGFIYLDGGGENKHPTGSVDEMYSDNEQLIVRGWAYDPDSPDTPVSLHVYVGNIAGSGASCYTTDVNGNEIKANQYRPDMNRNWGFEVRINVRERGNQNIFIYAINNEGGHNPELGLTAGVSRNVFINQVPMGHVDKITGGVGSINLTGWAFDKDDVSQSLYVHVYIGGNSGTVGAECVSVYANVSRKDVDIAYHVGEYHGFYASIPTTKTGNQEVYVYAIDIGKGENKEIGHATVNIAPVNNPVSSLDSLTGGNGSIHVFGWTYDKDDLTQSLAVHVYIGGSSSTLGTECVEITANVSRKDVDNAHHIGEFHGFDATIPTSKIGMQDVYVYAINIGSGENVEIGHGQVYIFQNPVGSVDQIYSENGQLIIRGWAYDPDSPDTPVMLHVYVGGETYVDGVGYYRDVNEKEFKANIYRPDLERYWGYELIIKVNERGYQNVYVYAINNEDGYNPKLPLNAGVDNKVYIEDEQTPETHFLLGDTDGDDEVTIIDATAIQRQLASLPTKAYNEKAADADEDGKVTILDATAIQRHLASLPTNERIGTLI